MTIARSVLLAALSLGLSAATAQAKSQVELGWPMDQVLSAALRFVRVDRNCKVVDRDDGAAFILFECEGDAGKTTTKRGALEIYKLKDLRGGDSVRVSVTLGDEPRYMELRFLELLERKIKEERGAPPPPPRPPPARPPVDAGA